MAQLDVKILPIQLPRDFAICLANRRDSHQISFRGQINFEDEAGAAGEKYLASLQAKIDADPFSCVHLWQNDQIIGQIEMSERAGRGYINFYYLQPKFRGQGYSQLLIQYSESFLRRKGYQDIRLSVSPSNEAALHFYQKHGWQDLGPRPDRPIVQQMQKSLRMQKWQRDFYAQAQVFLRQILSELKMTAIDIRACAIDHICFRTETGEDYIQCKSELSQMAELLTETQVNGRLIATFQLRESIEIEGRRIELVELPAPKPGRHYRGGFEHIEVVVGEEFNELVPRYRGLKWDTAGLQKALNPELELILPSGAVKFHEQSLREVVAIEKSLQGPLQNLELFARLRPYRPLISGSLPLELEVADSDVDVLCYASDLGDFLRDVRENFGQRDNFQSKEATVNGLQTAIVEFQAFGKTWQIFAQAKAPVQQVAHQHLQIESRLLSMAGDRARAQIRRLKEGGDKTEPAFAKYFAIDGDPYAELLHLGKLTDLELRQRLRLSLI